MYVCMYACPPVCQSVILSPLPNQNQTVMMFRQRSDDIGTVGMLSIKGTVGMLSITFWSKITDASWSEIIDELLVKEQL